MILYRAPWSTNVQRVTMALAHKGLDHEEVVISYDDRSPVEAVSGQPLVPVLVLDEHQSVEGRPNLAGWIERISTQQRGL